MQQTDRPFIIIRAGVSVDGRIALGPNRTMFDDMGDPRFQIDKERNSQAWTAMEVALKALHPCDADMLGSNSLVREGGSLRELPSADGFSNDDLHRDYLPDEVMNREDKVPWAIIVDGRGRCRSGWKGEGNGHALHLVSHGVAPEYLAFLRRERIPYFIAGQHQVDLPSAFRNLYHCLGVRHLWTSAAGKLCGAMLRRNLVDEVNLLVAPNLIGGTDTPCLFASPDLGPGESPTPLRLLTCQTLAQEYLWLRYTGKRSHEELPVSQCV
jgi:2,5-diamino-6-(ribosylamino)-4(3H)-pyrimidinone 5'-phosphate reductase